MFRKIEYLKTDKVDSITPTFCKKKHVIIQVEKKKTKSRIKFASMPIFKIKLYYERIVDSHAVIRNNRDSSHVP